MKRNLFIIVVSVLILAGVFVWARTTTTDLGLVKPTWDESFDILDDLNSNTDIIEAFANDPLEFDTGERLEDRVGAMVSGNTETFITLEYQDADNTLDAVVPVKDEDTMVSDSNTYLATQQSIKAYADGLHALQYLKTEIDTLSEVETIYGADITDSTELATALGDYYLKTAIDTQGEMETIWGVTLLNDITGESIFDLSDFPADPNADRFILWDDDPGEFTFVELTEAHISDLGSYLEDITTESILDLSDTPAAFDDGKFMKSGVAAVTFESITEADISDLGTYLEDITAESIFDLSDFPADPNADRFVMWDDDPGEFVWTAATGYTDLTEFVDQTAWCVFYSNTDGEVTELALGGDGTYLMSNGAAAAPTFETPAGGGDMLKATYDTGEDGIIDPAAGGTGVANNAASTLTISGNFATTFTVTEATGVTLPATGTLLANVSEDASPELGGELDAGAHSIGFTQQSTTGDGTTTIDWTLGNKFYFTFGAQNDTITFTHPTNPCNLLLLLKQDATGSRTVTWDGDVMWAGGTAPTLTTTGAAIDIVSFYYDGTNFYGVASLAFAIP